MYIPFATRTRTALAPSHQANEAILRTKIETKKDYAPKWNPRKIFSIFLSGPGRVVGSVADPTRYPL